MMFCIFLIEIETRPSCIMTWHDMKEYNNRTVKTLLRKLVWHKVGPMNKPVLTFWARVLSAVLRTNKVSRTSFRKSRSEIAEKLSQKKKKNAQCLHPLDPKKLRNLQALNFTIPLEQNESFWSSQPWSSTMRPTRLRRSAAFSLSPPPPSNHTCPSSYPSLSIASTRSSISLSFSLNIWIFCVESSKIIDWIVLVRLVGSIMEDFLRDLLLWLRFSGTRTSSGRCGANSEANARGGSG